MNIAYSGIKGAYAQIAASRIFPNEKIVSYKSFYGAYEAVVKKECDYCILPIENSYAGDVSQVLDLLYFGELSIVGVYEMRIVHYLLGNSGCVRENVTKVISHPQALDQCNKYINKMHFESEVVSNTAFAAREVALSNNDTFAAIASRETAKLYDLKIVDEDIGDSDDNTTRFAVIAKASSEMFNKGQAFSIVFTVANEAGSLAKAISIIGDRGFNMKSIRSRPSKKVPWNYYFYVEAEGDISTEHGKLMMKELDMCCNNVRIIGNYTEDIII